MEFTIYRDFSSIAFVRCTSPITGTQHCAEGTAFTLTAAREKCRSEVIERNFVRSLSEEERNTILGVAAHPLKEGADENAWCESLETIFLTTLNQNIPQFGFQLLLPGGLQFVFSKVDSRCFTLLRFSHDGAHAIVQAVSSSWRRSFLKTWAEYRNIKIYRPSAHDLGRYTKGNRILAEHDGNFMLFKKLRNNPVERTDISMHSEKTKAHHITYFKKENS